MNSKKLARRISFCFLSCFLIIPTVVSATDVQFSSDYLPGMKTLSSPEIQVNLLDAQSDFTESSFSVNLKRSEYKTSIVPSKILDKLKERLQSKSLNSQAK